MAVLELRDTVEVVEIDLVRLDETVIQDVIEAAERGSDPGYAETAHWSYSVPFPGVRYYSYEDDRQRPVGASPKLR
jgi:hypothetical protein